MLCHPRGSYKQSFNRSIGKYLTNPLKKYQYRKSRKASTMFYLLRSDGMDETLFKKWFSDDTLLFEGNPVKIKLEI